MDVMAYKYREFQLIEDTALNQYPTCFRQVLIRDAKTALCVDFMISLNMFGCSDMFPNNIMQNVTVSI